MNRLSNLLGGGRTPRASERTWLLDARPLAPVPSRRSVLRLRGLKADRRA